jgi:hypothetical protein
VTLRLIRLANRTVLLAFCLATTLYAFITSSTFAYLQFIKPRVFRWIGLFSDWHPWLSWIWLGLLAIHLWPILRTRTLNSWLARGLLACAAGLVSANALGSVVPRLSDGSRSIIVGLVSLIPVLWLAVVDHASAWPYLAGQHGPDDEQARDPQEGRLAAACIGTALLLTGSYAVLASTAIANTFEPDLLTTGLAVGVSSSLVGHLLVLAAAFASLALLLRIGGTSIARQHLLLFASVTIVVSVTFARFIGDPMGLRGNMATMAALAFGASVAASWGGMRLTAAARAGVALGSGLDVWLSPPSSSGGSSRLVVPLLAVLPLAWAFERLAFRVDWDFAVLKTGVVIVWIVTFALVYRAAPSRRIGAAIAVLPFAAAFAVHEAWHPSAAQQHVRDRYAVYNPSFLVVDALLREQPRSSSFDRYLRANTGLTDVQVEPVTIDFAKPLTAAAPPNIFLFVVDSLRADYLSPYNAAVRFTPRIAAFAADNLTLRNAFTRYGGTGLSMPAIWAGSVLAHKQYVQPFAPMNALEGLVDANGYTRIQTHDHITEALWSHTEGDIELEQGRTEMDFDFCHTVDELGTRLGELSRSPRPIFAQTRSLNLHVAEVRNGYVPPGRSYPGFEPPYAYRVERIDGCFGSFVDRLKQLHLYDRSIVVLTADHGELIGEDGRWGHSYHLFPQVIQVPLLVHLPAGADGRHVDTSAVSLSTDITPTIYAALGLHVTPPNALAGQSLLDPGSAIERRRTPFVLSASYGAVYAVLSTNGRRLYIADAIHEQEYAYERGSVHDVQWSEVPVSAGRRAVEQLRIRRHVDFVARTYGLERPF